MHLWPQTLRLPDPSLKTIYLDLNHWIALAQVRAGRSDGSANHEVLEFCRQASEARSAVFPISLSTFMEVLKIKDRERRKSLRMMIEELSRYMVVAHRAVVAAHEMEALLDRQVGRNPTPIHTMEFLDWGVSRAMGRRGGFRVVSAAGEDVTEEVRQSFADGPEAFDKILEEANWELNRQLLEGPSMDEESKLRQQGYNPEAILEDYEREAEAETELARRLDDEPKWRRGRLRDVVAAWEMEHKIDSIWQRGCRERGVGALSEAFPPGAASRRAFYSMPSFDASVTLRASIHKNSNHHWRNNHVHDIHALAVALPYCDVVITDREMVSHAERTGLAKRFNTRVLSRLSELL